MANTPLILALVMPNLAAWLSLLTLIGLKRGADGKFFFETIVKPSWFPPKWLFGLAETVLAYTGMGYAVYAIHLDDNDDNKFTEPRIAAITLYVIQLLLNYAWSPIFFRTGSLFYAFICQVTNLVFAVPCSVLFAIYDPLTLVISVPYLGWLAFTNCLNYSLWQLNKNGGSRTQRLRRES